MYATDSEDRRSNLHPIFKLKYFLIRVVRWQTENWVYIITDHIVSLNKIHNIVHMAYSVSTGCVIKRKQTWSIRGEECNNAGHVVCEKDHT